MKPRRNPRHKPAIPKRTKLSRKPGGQPLRPEQVVSMRDLFWQNVLREMLTSLSTMWQQVSTAPNATESPALPAAQASPSTQPPPHTPSASAAAADGTHTVDPALFDGRLAILTKAGDRIAIASIIPLFGCGVNAPNARELSLAIECTIFQIRTPDGHVFTIPIQEIRAFHALSPEIMAKLEQAARRRAARRESHEDAPPFGFAAFTSLARGSLPLEPPPSQPME